MELREAILRAADSIEKYPDHFKFTAITVPELTCNTPGCAIGWIALHNQTGWKAKHSPGHTFWAAEDVIGVDSMKFYNRMDELEDFGLHYNQTWRRDHLQCARLLRSYANRYHPAKTEHPKIPATTLAIFQTHSKPVIDNV